MAGLRSMDSARVLTIRRRRTAVCATAVGVRRAGGLGGEMLSVCTPHPDGRPGVERQGLRRQGPRHNDTFPSRIRTATATGEEARSDHSCPESFAGACGQERPGPAHAVCGITFACVYTPVRPPAIASWAEQESPSCSESGSRAVPGVAAARCFESGPRRRPACRAGIARRQGPASGAGITRRPHPDRSTRRTVSA